MKTEWTLITFDEVGWKRVIPPRRVEASGWGTGEWSYFPWGGITEVIGPDFLDWSEVIFSEINWSQV